MLINRQNSHAPHGKQRTGRREAQSHELVKKVKKTLCITSFENLKKFKYL
jgi:hypothetical protein